MITGMPVALAADNDRAVSSTGTLDFTTSYGDADPDDTQKSIPNATEALKNVDDFSGGYDVLSKDEPMDAGFVPLYHYELNLTHVSIYNDHDTIGAGDIFISCTANGMIDDDMMYNHYDNYDLGQFNDYESAEYNAELYSGSAIGLHLFFQLYDDDAGIADNILVFDAYMDGYTDCYVENADARVEFTVTKTYLGQANATDYINAYKPYLYLDDEDGNVPPDMAFARAIEGYDPLYGSDTLCLQYIFYWDQERTGTGTLIHYWDFEEVLIYVDPTTSRTPHRYVFDEGFYFETGEDWRNGQEYAIYDANRTNLGAYYRDVNFTEELQPFLGTSRTMDYTWKSVDEVYDGGIENWCMGASGTPTIQLTVETSYHAFDKGDPASGGEEQGQDYGVQYLNDTVIRALYASLDTSFREGLLVAEQTPKYSPFSFDLCQPFTAPYIINNFPTLLTDAAAFNGAKDRRSTDFNFTKDIGITVSIPYETSMTFPKQLDPGDTVDAIVDMTLKPGQTVIRVDYWMNLVGNLSLWFFGDQEINVTLDNSIVLDFGENTLDFGGFTIGLEDAYAMDTELGEFVDLQVSGNLGIVGDLLDADITVKLCDILKFYIPQYEWLIDMFFGEINLHIVPNLDAAIGFDLDVDGTAYPVVYEDDATQQIPVSYDVAAIGSPDDELRVKLNSFEYNLTASVDWSLEFVWGWLSNLVTEEESLTWQIGTWPDYEFTMFESDKEFTLLTYRPDEGVWVRFDPNQGGLEPMYIVIGAVAAVGIGIGVFVALRAKRAAQEPADPL